MKEQLHTIPISDAMANAGECPFCYIEQKTEEHMMDFVLGHGASYMEADIRDMTDREGFCRAHFKKMFDYGNSLGNAWILKTLMKRHEEEMDHVWKTFRPDAAAKRNSLFGKKTDGSSNSIVEWINRRESTCFICNSVKNTFQAYMKTFFSMYKKDADFRAQVANTKGFCLDHFKVLCEGADEQLSGEEKKENQITNNVDNGTTADGTEKEEQSATETVEEPADSEETNDPFAEIPQVVLSKPVDYSLNQAIRQLEQMEASDERYAQIVENAEKYPEKLLINLANNPEMIAFVADYKGNTRDYDKAELTEKELQEEYPLFLQWDKRWGCLAYGDDSNVAISGCGPTTLAMAVVALTGNDEATPAAIAKFAMQEGYYMSGTGTMWSLMTEGAAAYGVRSEQINISQIEIKQHLDQGDIVICSVRQGDFTTGGHFILLYDYDDEDEYYDEDEYSEEDTEETAEDTEAEEAVSEELTEE